MVIECILFDGAELAPRCYRAPSRLGLGRGVVISSTLIAKV